MRSVAIIQSNYIPWKGYFNIIKCVDDFVLLDDVQFTRRDWRNRNLIKSRYGLKWLTIPVDVKGNYYVKIKDVCSVGTAWRKDHWSQITEAYRSSPYFQLWSSYFEELYLGSDEVGLSKINFNFIKLINSILKIETPIHWSMNYDSPMEKTERLIHICECLHASEYVTGPSAKDYLNVEQFHKRGIQVVWADYSNFPPYNQPNSPFEHSVSIIDLLFNEGPNALQFLKKRIWN